MGIGFCPGGGSSGPGCNTLLASAAGWPLGCACVGSSGSATFDEDDFSFLSFFFFSFSHQAQLLEGTSWPTSTALHPIQKTNLKMHAMCFIIHTKNSRNLWAALS